METETKNPVVLLLTTAEGATVGVRFANREMAEAFERRHQVDGYGVVPILSQGEAILRGALR